ncbi:TetR family transcriptional regulator [Glycomyces sp. L485]|uniref:TetR/AcrR family transcriptional regulator n=1 Tax=Glycomyces sp. L485 TaxID=2909235 RepID=UPI001F4A212C|nr:TetR/AcrR family transcriptional regulator [Glycomyces sp. L485]MCH7231375.1 TetR family transcriptional regulator [Glycomyces sp. L485]
MSTATVPAARQPTMSPTPKFGAAHSLRRLPVQERSAARVRRMLDAAADLIEEVGYDRLSTTAIAQRADVAIGSVYQFFGDKRSLAEVLSQRYIDLYFERLTARFDSEPPADWRAGVEAAVGEYVHMYRTAPGFRVLHLADAIDPGGKDGGIATGGDHIAEKMRAGLEQRFGIGGDQRLSETVTVAVETGQALVRLAFRRDAEGDASAIAEAKRVICEYVARRLS